MKELEKLSDNDQIHVEGSINGTYTIGHVIKLNNLYYFFQNNKKGSRPANSKHPITELYTYSWAFHIREGLKLSDGVIINRIINENDMVLNEPWYQRHLKVTNSNSRSSQISISDTSFVRIKDSNGKLSIFKNNGPGISLFKQTPHSDCCGCQILFNFENSSGVYCRYKNLIISDYKIIFDHLNVDRAAKIAHITDNQSTAKDFVERLGFQLQYSYVNNNSKNTINVYHFNPGEHVLNEKKIEKEVSKENNLKTQNSKEEKKGRLMEEAIADLSKTKSEAVEPFINFAERSVMPEAYASIKK